ncbi:probable peroxidase 26 [Elaeis guineensis]|uniref:Peroxidase n=1 Tax=Elaeis guineensis var. tenera TaxID=51953 RepID=A0A6I9QK88_ELAGV|nr:probable peroxidase 26 [Elaeis guineensis]
MRCKGQWLLVFLVLHLWATHLHVAEGATKLPLNGLVLHYYKKHTNCTYAEEFIKHLVTKAWQFDKSITPALLRLAYSDCFVRGCDASILLDGKNSEKEAPQNSGLRGFDVIDRIKRVLEARCPGTVSCADIIQLAAKNAVALAGAPKYPVFTGRRDGVQSTVESVDLPPPSISWDQALAYFQSRGLDVLDLGTLLGAHTMGVTHCHYIHDRIHNFNHTGKPDPSMARSLARQLRGKCQPKCYDMHQDPTVFLNPISGKSYTFSNSYYKRVLRNLGVLGIDQQITSSEDGRRIADQFAHNFEDFRRYFAFTMSRMGSIGVLTGTKGEIRSHCRYTNAENPKI